jgi:hypothetical protein
VQETNRGHRTSTTSNKISASDTDIATEVFRVFHPPEPLAWQNLKELSPHLLIFNPIRSQWPIINKAAFCH